MKKGLRWGRNGAIAGLILGTVLSVSDNPQYWRFSSISPGVIAFLSGAVLGPAILFFVVGFIIGWFRRNSN